MTNAAFALRKAVYARLTGDLTVTSPLGGARIFDEVPRGETPPYVVLGEGQVSDWSTGSDRGDEHALTLMVWSQQGGTAEVFALADAVVASLETMPEDFDGHHLVNLVALATDVKRENTGRFLRGTVRIRAVTERVGSS